MQYQHPELHPEAPATGRGGGGGLASSSSVDDDNIGVREVNWLLEACGIDRSQPIVDLKQCSSSLFVLLFRRLFDVSLPNLELEPDTFEKKLFNTKCVLKELEDILKQPIGHISAEEIVLLNKEHILALIRIFVSIVYAMQQPEEGESRVEGESGPEAASSVDSAQKTQELVADWKEGVLPPPSRKTGQRVDPTSVAALKEQIKRVEHFTGKKERPKRHLSRTRVNVVPLAQQRLSVANLARDAKIERLRSHRYIESLQREVRSTMAKESNRTEVHLRHKLQRKLKQQQVDLIETKRAAYDEDKRYRDAYACVVASARNHFQTQAQILTEETAHIAQRSAASSREARRTAQEYGQLHRRKIESQYKQYVDSMCSWRNAAFFE